MKTIVPDHVPAAENPHRVDVRHLHRTPHVTASVITLQPSEAIHPHKAPVDIFFYVLQGTPTLEIEGEAQTLSPDTLVPSVAGCIHSIRNETHEQARVLVVKTPNPAR